MGYPLDLTVYFKIVRAELFVWFLTLLCTFNKIQILNQIDLTIY